MLTTCLHILISSVCCNGNFSEPNGVLLRACHRCCFRKRWKWSLLLFHGLRFTALIYGNCSSALQACVCGRFRSWNQTPPSMHSPRSASGMWFNCSATCLEAGNEDPHVFRINHLPTLRNILCGGRRTSVFRSASLF